jgi:hypothetical protein
MAIKGLEVNKMNEYQTYSKGPRKGQPKTLADRVIRFATEGMRCKEVPSKSRYRKFEIPDRPGRFYFIGKNGAVRVGWTVSNSISVTSEFQAKMVSWEHKEGILGK